MQLGWARTLLSIAAMGAVCAISAATARPDLPPEALAPTSPWNIDYADESCRLERAFGPVGSKNFH
jgi:hypothetical protein